MAPKQSKPTQAEIEACLIEILNGDEAGLNPEGVPLEPSSLLGADLNLTSIDVLHVLASIDMRLRRKLPFQELVITPDGYVNDLSVARIAEFIHANYERALVSPS
jgi:acyl carrier protein